MSRLQSVQNAAARLVSGVQRYDHMTPVLYSLQVAYGFRFDVGCMDFKIDALVYRSLFGMATASRPPTVCWSPTKVVVSCVLPNQGRLLLNGPTATIEKDILQLRVRSCEIAFQLI